MVKTKRKLHRIVETMTHRGVELSGIEKDGKFISKLQEIRLDLGCGPNKKPGFVGVDCIKFQNVDVVFDLTRRKQVIAEVIDGYPRMLSDPVPVGEYLQWPWFDNSIEEAHASHFLEHLERLERWHFFNELYRVLKPGAKATIITPDWSSQRAYGDMTHKWPPVSGFFWFYLSKEWRKANAPHNDSEFVKGGLNCNFGATWGPTVHPEVATRNQEYQQHAITFFKEACQDMVCTLVKA